MKRHIIGRIHALLKFRKYLSPSEYEMCLMLEDVDRKVATDKEIRGPRQDTPCPNCESHYRPLHPLMMGSLHDEDFYHCDNIWHEEPDRFGDICGMCWTTACMTDGVHHQCTGPCECPYRGEQ